MSTKSITIKILNKETQNEWVANYQEFDKNGNEIETKDFDYDGSITSRISTKYDNKNRKSEVAIYSEGDFLGERHEFSYDGDTRRLLKEEIVYADMSKSIKSYSYNGNKINITTKDENDEIEEIEDLEIDEKGRITRRKVTDDLQNITTNQKSEFQDDRLITRYDLDSNDKEISHLELTYDTNGQVTVQKTIGANKKIFDTNSYQYDNHGREILRVIGNRGKIETVYDDEKRQTISTTRAITGQIFSSTISTYDELGRIVEEEDATEIKKYEYKDFE